MKLARLVSVAVAALFLLTAPGARAEDAEPAGELDRSWLEDDWLAAPPDPERHNLLAPTLEALGGMAVVLGGTMIDPEFSHTESPSLDNWVEAFTKPPQPDKDGKLVNWVLHPEMGAELYLLLRNREYGVIDSFLFSTAGSVFWEYVAEGSIERPSYPDLLLTSPIGSLFGELRYQVRQWLIRKPPTTWRDVGIVAADGIEAFHRWLDRPGSDCLCAGAAPMDPARTSFTGLGFTVRF